MLRFFQIVLSLQFCTLALDLPRFVTPMRFVIITPAVLPMSSLTVIGNRFPGPRINEGVPFEILRRLIVCRARQRFMQHVVEGHVFGVMTVPFPVLPEPAPARYAMRFG